MILISYSHFFLKGLYYKISPTTVVELPVFMSHASGASMSASEVPLFCPVLCNPHSCPNCGSLGVRFISSNRAATVNAVSAASAVGDNCVRQVYRAFKYVDTTAVRTRRVAAYAAVSDCEGAPIAFDTATFLGSRIAVYGAICDCEGTSIVFDASAPVRGVAANSAVCDSRITAIVVDAAANGVR